jgi:hypothetical protein
VKDGLLRAAVQRPNATPTGTDTTLRATARIRLIPGRLALSCCDPDVSVA